MLSGKSKRHRAFITESYTLSFWGRNRRRALSSGKQDDDDDAAAADDDYDANDEAVV